MATETARYNDDTGLLLVNEEVDSDKDVEIFIEEEEEDDEPYIGEGLFTFADFDDHDGDDEVPDHDPLSTDINDDDVVLIDDDVILIEDDEVNFVGTNPSNLGTMKASQKKTLSNQDNGVIQSEAEDLQTPLIITSVESLQIESVAGSNGMYKPAFFRNLEIFRCFLCRSDFNTFDELLAHRTHSRFHIGVPYDAELEKAFLCGICQRPWNQPRKALACAVYGHDPSKIYESMFIHSCPLCPENCFAFHSLAAVGRHWALEHPDKPLPPFLYKCSSKDQLPSIKVTYHETSLVSESLVEENPRLVLDNVAASTAAIASSPSYKIPVKIYRCSECQSNFETRREVEVHHCSAKKVAIIAPTAERKRFICEDCGREYPCARNFRLHLMRAGACKKDENIKKEDYPYKCIFCGCRYLSFKAYMCHRSKTHALAPYNAALELPFACKICLKPAFVQKEAMICALFAHDPSGLAKAMFKYKCTQCISFGFHSPLALKRHWESEHPTSELPANLRSVTVDRALPTVTITLNQLLEFKRLKHLGSSLVVERDIHPSLAKFASVKPITPFIKDVDETKPNDSEVTFDETLKLMTPPKRSVEVAYVSADQVESSDIIRKVLIEESVQNKSCVICNQSFKDMRRHFRIHDHKRFAGTPKHKCVCGKVYHLRNSLHSHWRNNQSCKIQCIKEREENTNQVVTKTEPQKIEITSTETQQEYVLRIPSPSHSPVDMDMDMNIKVEMPEINAVAIEEDFATPDIMPLQTTMTDIDLESGEYAEFDSEGQCFETSAETETIDFSNFIHLEVEEVQDDCDNNMEVDNTSSDSDNIVGPKRQRLCMCLICNKGFLTQVAFMSHMTKEHTDTHPFPCRHCGKRFKLNDQRRKHETIHDPNRFNGEPKFSCDKCDQKYHLKTSLETHRKMKHLGYIKPKPRVHLPIVQHRSIGVGRKRLQRLHHSHECTKCNVKFDFNYQLRQHIARIHDHVITNRPSRMKPLNMIPKTKSKPVTVKRYSCGICQRSFAKPFQLDQHHLIHTGEKPHVCDHCGRSFRLRKSLNAHKLIHAINQKKHSDNTYKCCVCGRQDFRRSNDLHQHRLRKHKDIPYDKQRERAFGCGVCGKPCFLRSQAMVCAILGHDPAQLLEVMFKHKCPGCPAERLGYHNLASLRNHWIAEHPHKSMPARFLPSHLNAGDALPYISINKEKALEIKEKGPTEVYDFPLVVEFETLNPDSNSQDVEDSPTSSPSPPPPVLERQDNSPPPPDCVTEEDLFLSTIITLSDALVAVRAVVSNGFQNVSKQQPKTKKKQVAPSPKKGKPSKRKEENLRDSLAEDRVLGNKRIAKVLERIRTARARKACTKEYGENNIKKDNNNVHNTRGKSKR